MAPLLPRYRTNCQVGDIRAKAEQAATQLLNCTLCPRQCRVDRSSGQTGYCRTGSNAVIANFDAHFGEEAPLVGESGSGTIFFTHCNLLCNFCQNYDISNQGFGRAVSDAHLAEIMLSLQASGCHNINFVTPSHVVPQILSALAIAIDKGLSIPLVYNSSGYDSVETLQILDGVIDIYMPDFKFWDLSIAEQTCNAPDYSQIAQQALIEMHQQVGDLKMDKDGIAISGLLVRHLVLPKGLADTKKIMTFIATHISSQTYVNVMSQYRPCGKAAQFESLNRPITNEEYKLALKETLDVGITRIDRWT